VADRGDGLLGRGEGLNQGEGGWVRGEIEHGWFFFSRRFPLILRPVFLVYSRPCPPT
jgi:hypothetical protein